MINNNNNNNNSNSNDNNNDNINNNNNNDDDDDDNNNIRPPLDRGDMGVLGYLLCYQKTVVAPGPRNRPSTVPSSDSSEIN